VLLCGDTYTSVIGYGPLLKLWFEEMENCRTRCSSTLFFAAVGLWWIYKKYFNSTPPMISSSSTSSVKKSASPKPATASVESIVEPLNLPIIDLDLIFQRDSQPEKFQMECNKIAQGHPLPPPSTLFIAGY
jgi:hypothetical protein